MYQSIVTYSNLPSGFDKTIQLEASDGTVMTTFSPITSPVNSTTQWSPVRNRHKDDRSANGLSLSLWF